MERHGNPKRSRRGGLRHFRLRCLDASGNHGHMTVIICHDPRNRLRPRKRFTSWGSSTERSPWSRAATEALGLRQRNSSSPTAPTYSSPGGAEEELERAAKDIGRNVTTVQGDVSNLADIDRLYAVVRETKGQVDIIFANAGIAESLPLGSITEEHFDRHFDINVKDASSPCRRTAARFATVESSS